MLAEHLRLSIYKLAMNKANCLPALVNKVSRTTSNKNKRKTGKRHTVRLWQCTWQLSIYAFPAMLCPIMLIHLHLIIQTFDNWNKILKCTISTIDSLLVLCPCSTFTTTVHFGPHHYLIHLSRNNRGTVNCMTVSDRQGELPGSHGLPGFITCHCSDKLKHLFELYYLGLSVSAWDIACANIACDHALPCVPCEAGK